MPRHGVVPGRLSDAVTRLIDIMFGATALIVLSPVLLLIALVLRLTGEREVFYRQQRIGRGERPFKLYKFATMLKDSAQLGTRDLTVRNDPRVLPFGRLLRQTKLNEIPQLLNVLRGDMSLIGPRPQTREHFDLFPPEACSVISTVRPGLSGAGSVVFRNEDRIVEKGKDKVRFYEEIISPYKAEVEVWYIERRSLGLYVLMIVVTILIVVFPGVDYRKFMKDLPVPPAELKTA